MVLCCGKKSIATSDGVVPSTRNSLRDSLISNEVPEETEWKVGGRYKVQQATPIFTTAALNEESGTLKTKTVVLLLSVQVKACLEIALVVPGDGSRQDNPKPGWIVLQDPTEDKSCLVRKRLEGSWDMKARYRVKNPATVRKEKSLSSEWVAEVTPGNEVVVLELGVEEGTSGEARLRALVSDSSSGLIGWISPETTAGDCLLDPVNLLGMEVVEMHRQSIASGSPARRASFVGRGRSNSVGSEGGPRRSCTPGSTVPWEVGGKYRVLEKLVVRERPDLTSRETGKIPAGALVTISGIHQAECASLGWCPCACVTADEGVEEVVAGWVRCAAKDGHDLIDTRDQLESEKILHKLRTSQSPVSTSGAEQTPGQRERSAEDRSEAGRDEETSETASDRSSSNSRRQRSGSSSGSEARLGAFPRAPGGLEGNFFLDKLESMEGAREDRPFSTDANAMEGPEKSRNCVCDCGSGFRRRR